MYSRNVDLFEEEWLVWRLKQLKFVSRAALPKDAFFRLTGGRCLEDGMICVAQWGREGASQIDSGHA